MNFFTGVESCTMKPIAYSYKRWSSSLQGKGHTEERQTELAEEYARREGLTLDAKRTMVDEGVSGYTGKNVSDGALGAFLKAIEAKQIEPGSFLLIEDIDRLSRLPVMEALGVFQQIIGAGVTIVTLRDGQKYSMELLRGDWTPLMPVLFAMARGHGESQLKSDRIGKAWAKKKIEARESLKPIGNNCPMWINYSEKTGYTLDPDRTTLVKRVFQLYIDGYGLVVISRMLNEEGIYRTSRGKAWGASSLDRILKNRAAIGEYQPGSGSGKARSKAGDAIRNFYPAAIDEVTFHRAQKARASRLVSGASRQPKSYNVWQGIAKCDLCGSALHLIDKGSPSKSVKYLHCYASKKGVCKAGYLRLEVAELVFREVLAKMNSSFSLVHESSAKLARQIDQIDAQISEQQDGLRQLSEAIKGVFSPTLMSEVLRREAGIADLNKQREGLSASLASRAITDKKAFFKALDLVSYEGRNRANALLKELGVTVRINPALSMFRVMQGDEPAFTIMKAESDFRFYPGNYELSGIIQRQEGTFTPTLAVDPGYIQPDDTEGWEHVPAEPEASQKPRRGRRKP